MSDQLAIVITVLGALLTAVSVIVTIFAAETRAMIVGTFGRLTLKTGRISGVWRATYVVPGGPDKGKHSEILSVRQLGKSIDVRSVKSRRLRARGRIQDNRYVTGTWWHPKPNSVHHGAFQLIIEPNGNELRGMWVGYHLNGQPVQCGKWEWTRSEEVVLSKRFWNPTNLILLIWLILMVLFSTQVILSLPH